MIADGQHEALDEGRHQLLGDARLERGQADRAHRERRPARAPRRRSPPSGGAAPRRAAAKASYSPARDTTVIWACAEGVGLDEAREHGLDREQRLEVGGERLLLGRVLGPAVAGARRGSAPAAGSRSDRRRRRPAGRPRAPAGSGAAPSAPAGSATPPSGPRSQTCVIESPGIRGAELPDVPVELGVVIDVLDRVGVDRPSARAAPGRPKSATAPASERPSARRARGASASGSSSAGSRSARRSKAAPRRVPLGAGRRAQQLLERREEREDDHPAEARARRRPRCPSRGSGGSPRRRGPRSRPPSRRSTPSRPRTCCAARRSGARRPAAPAAARRSATGGRRGSRSR